MKIHLQNEKKLTIKRLPNGVLSVDAQTMSDLFFGQGYAQALDRSMQMILMRIVGQGRICELVLDDDNNLHIDMFFRKMNWNNDLEKQVQNLSPGTLEYLSAWSEGINKYWQQKLPWECKLLGISVEPWKISDSILFIRMMGYINLQQSQADMETMLIQMIQKQVPLESLKELFGNHLDGIDIDLIQKIQQNHRIIPSDVVWHPWISSTISSNNWVISGSRTDSGNPILANDPHLEGNRLPNVWQEMLLKCNENYYVGAGVPGIPGILIGRNSDVSWGATYSFMDSVDSWIEKCKDEKYFCDNSWHNFNKRKEIIKRKKNPDSDIIFYENDHGTLDGIPNNEDYYTATKWASSHAGANSLNAMVGLLDVKTVSEAMDCFGQVEVSFNWVIADTQNNIGYQMSGLHPIRVSGWSGLYPIDGTNSKNNWQGFHDYTQLPRSFNPECGYIITANNNLNHLGEVNPINLPMGSYRADTIENLIKNLKFVSAGDCVNIQYNTFSIQAQKIMEILSPILDDSPAANILKKWYFHYDFKSKGAWIFERFYEQLLREVFEPAGENFFEFLFRETGIITDFYANFDNILLSQKSLWFHGKTREQVFRNAMNKSICPLKKTQIKTWGKNNSIELTNIVFASKLPRWLGFDYGPVEIVGGRATPHQGQIYRSGGRTTSFVPSLRMIIDMNLPGIMSHLLGGPSDRRFSLYYTSEVDMWHRKRYKYIHPDVEQESVKFSNNLDL